jgi:hypothetical protein
MQPMRDLDPVLRRARLKAARLFGLMSIPRRAILRGDWDSGQAVRQFM